MTTGIVLLAAGAGRRFHGPTHKLLAPVGGADPGPVGAADPRPTKAAGLGPVDPTGGAGRRSPSVWQVALDRAQSSAVGPVLVVTGQARLTLPAGVLGVHNARWADGQATSLATGLDTARTLGWAAAVVGLADQPGITAAAWQAVAASTAPIAVATYDGRRANPVRLGREVWNLVDRTGDEGARSLMRLRPDLVHEVPCSGQPVDIDTVEDLDQWSSSTTSP